MSCFLAGIDEDETPETQEPVTEDMPPLEGDEDDASRMEEVDWVYRTNFEDCKSQKCWKQKKHFLFTVNMSIHYFIFVSLHVLLPVTRRL